MIALIQAGGAGTRLKSITGDLPKPMVPICGKPILQWQIENLKASGCNHVILVVSKNGTAVQDYFGFGDKFGIKIEYIVEQEPLGTGGALYFASKMIDEDFALLFGDLMIDVDWNRFFAFHQKREALIPAFAHPNGHPADSDVLVADADGKVRKMLSKHDPRDFFYENLTNAGLYIVSREILHRFTEPVQIDFEKEVLAPSIPEERIYAYRSSEYVKDCGTPDRYYGVTADCQNGIIAARNLAKPQPCIFLDRDGTINHFGDYVIRPEMLLLEPGAAQAIKKINASPYLAICITNQPIVARGETTIEQLQSIHFKLEDLLGQEGAYLNDLYFCPHHPDRGFPGENPAYKIDCDCRKPKIGLLLRAQRRYNIDFKNSWMIGDTCQDVQTGINAGCHTCLLLGGDPNPYKKYADAKPDLICQNLAEAIDKILALK